MPSFAVTRSRPSQRGALAVAAVMAAFLGGRPLTAQTPASAAEPGPVLTLVGLLDSVAVRHPLVEAARARVRAARGARTTAGALGNPVLGYDVENAALPGRDAPPMDREVMATVTLPLEVLYQRGARVRRANADVRAAEADAVASRQRIALDATRAFYRAALAEVSLAAARDLSGWLDTVVAYNRARVREGATAEADLLRSELERDRAAADATMEEADLIRSRANLATFLGDVTFPLGGLAVTLDDRPLPLPAVTATLGPPVAPALPSDQGALGAMRDDALARRPEVRAARERLAAAGAGVGAERSMFLRQLGATVGTKESGGATSLVAGVSLPIPLFDQNRGEIARATAERQAARFELAAEERAVRADILGAYEAARVLTVRAGALAAAADSGRTTGYLARADEARRIALGAYREGAVPLLQVLDAARAWGEARVAFYRTLYAQHEGVIALLAAQGTDLFTAVPALEARGPSTR